MDGSEGELSWLEEIDQARDKATDNFTCLPTPMGCGKALTEEDFSYWNLLKYQASGLCPTCQRWYHQASDDWT